MFWPRLFFLLLLSYLPFSHAQTLNQQGQLTVNELAELAVKYIQERKYADAVELLKQAIEQTDSSSQNNLPVLLHNDLGRAYSELNESVLAARAFQQAIRIADDIQRFDLLLASQFNLLLLPRSGLSHDQRVAHFEQALSLIEHGIGKSVFGLQFGLVAIKDFEETENSNYLLQAKKLLQTTVKQLEVAASVSDQKFEALGQLGKVHRLDRQFDQAIEYTGRAITGAEKTQNLEQLYRWYWQMAVIKTDTANINDALSYYQLAVVAHQKIFVTPVSQSGTGPENHLYNSYLSLLLKQGENSPRQDSYYQQAIHLIEKLRTADIQDYFKHRCVADSRIEVSNVNDVIDSKTAVLYPLMVDDRFEVFLVTRGKIYRGSSRLNSVALATRISNFRHQLEQLVDNGYLQQAGLLYGDLLGPFDNIINQLKLSQLIVVPDLLTAAIPYAALHDGNQFLVERFKISVAPSVELTRSSQFSGQASRALYAGISLPVLNLPALQQVKQEINISRQYIPGDVLLNRQFSADQVSSKVENGLYNILHIASHSKIAADVESSYVVTYDGQINLDSLQNMVSKVQFSNSPIDLLTLSACSTAVGDQKAALGFAGLAVKSGARSVLASLWSIDDTATSQLVTEFYRILSSGQFDKVESIRKAQLSMLDDVRYQHPGYWAAFTLIGDWN